MPSDDHAESWILDRLARAAAGDSVDVLKRAWDAQLEQALRRLESTGRLLRDGDTVRQASSVMPSETAHNVIAQTYVGLLRAEHTGQPVNRPAALAKMTKTTGLTPAKIEALMCNMSAVVQELGYEYLGAYPPKSNVPVGVRPAVRRALDL